VATGGTFADANGVRESDSRANYGIALFNMAERQGLRKGTATGSRRGAKGARQGRAAPQLALAFPNNWGGARPGAGRKPNPRRNTPHRARPKHSRAEPVHVTLRARLAPLRSQHVFPTVRLALLRAGQRDPKTFRLVHFSVQHDHVHLIVEANDKRSLSSGIRSVAVRVARYVNDLLARRGTLWADRYHSRPLRTPSEVRRALVYVLANFRKHALSSRPSGIDPCSSGAWFDGWCVGNSSGVPPSAQCARSQVGARRDEPVVAAAATWLARVGWRRHGLIGLDEGPAGSPS
jgi:REP element-mobilizing transposase RayT